MLLAPRTDAADGRPRLPSRLLLRLASLAAGRPVGLDEFLERRAARGRCGAGSPGRRRSRDDARLGRRARARHRRCCSALSSSGGRAAPPRSYAGAVLGDEAARRPPLRRLARGQEPGAGRLGRPARRRGPRRARGHGTPSTPRCTPRASSATSAARSPSCCATCSGWTRPTSPATRSRWTPREFGTLAHDILQRAYEQVIAGDLRAGRRPGRPCVAAWETCCAEAESRGVTGAALSWEVRRELLLEDLLETVRRDPVFARPRRAARSGVEWRFGEAVDRPVVARPRRAAGAVRFAGRLDRVDADAARGARHRLQDGRRRHRAQPHQGTAQRAAARLPARRAPGRRAASYDEIACLYRLVTRRGGFEDLDLPRGRGGVGAPAARARRRARSRWSTPACSRVPRASAATTATCATRAASPAGRGRASASTSCSTRSAACSRPPAEEDADGD